MSMTPSDLVAGAAIGAVGSIQGIELPGMMLIGLGYDLSIAVAYKMNPKWFPNNQQITVEDLLSTALGTAIGWTLMRMLIPHMNPAALPAAAAGLSVLPIAGRPAGRMRFATYRGGR